MAAANKTPHLRQTLAALCITMPQDPQWLYVICGVILYRRGAMSWLCGVCVNLSTLGVNRGPLSNLKIISDESPSHHEYFIYIK